MHKNIMINYISFVIAGITGILVNTFILSVYNSEILGNFNFIFSFLVILSQFGVGGIQFSVLKHNSHYGKNLVEVSRLMISALLLSTLLSSILLTILYFIAPVLENIFTLEYFTQSIYLIIPGILFFSLNKILLMSLNGLNLMKEYAIFNLLRYLLLIFFIVCFYFLDYNAEYIVVTLSISEFLLFMSLTVYIYSKIIIYKKPKVRWIKRHFLFGIKGMWGGALMETNTRVDILMIGAFLGYGAVGIYSFASMIAEGFAQVYTILKNNVDPVFGNAYHKKNYEEIISTIRDIRKIYIPYVLLFGFLVIVLYKFVFITVFGLEVDLIEKSWYTLLILIVSMMLTSYYKPFIGLLNQINRPGKFSQIIFFSVVLNIILNIILIPRLGIYGAAISTSVVFFIESYYLYKIGSNMVNNMFNLKK